MTVSGPTIKLGRALRHERFMVTSKSLRPDEDISKWVWLVPAIALLVAILPLPYSYYMGLRWVVAGAAAYIGWKEYNLNRNAPNSYVWIFGAISIVFNPIVPIHLFKSAWIVINLITAAAFLGHYRLRTQNN